MYSKSISDEERVLGNEMQGNIKMLKEREQYMRERNS